MFKPEGYNSLSSYLIVDDAQATADFIKAVFDVEPHCVHHADDGAIAHAEVWIDDTILMFGQWKGSGAVAHVHVYVPDVRNSFERPPRPEAGSFRTLSARTIPTCAAASLIPAARRGGCRHGRTDAHARRAA